MKRFFWCLAFLPCFLMSLEIKVLVGDEILPYNSQLAVICNSVFSEYPYLYDGTDEGYTENLSAYGKSKNGLIAIAMDQEKVVGVATGLPLDESWSKYAEPIQEAGYDVRKVFYLGELVLLPKYRDQGLGPRLYNEVEKFAKERGYRLMAFNQIENVLQAPSDYQSLTPFWTSLGFERHGELHLNIDWVNVGDKEASPHHMVYWIKTL